MERRSGGLGWGQLVADRVGGWEASCEAGSAAMQEGRKPVTHEGQQTTPARVTGRAQPLPKSRVMPIDHIRPINQLGHPILGDSLYARDFDISASPRLCLHAESLEFTHPVTGERLDFSLPAPF